MAKRRLYTNLGVSRSLTVDIDGREYEVVFYAGTNGKNEIPSATILLAVGRTFTKSQSGQLVARVAEVHRAGHWKQMTKATVWFSPSGEMRPNKNWPSGRVKLFEGYVSGASYQKAFGKMHVSLDLTHWLVDLASSSSLTPLGHVANPAALNADAVLRTITASGGQSGPPIVSMLAAAVPVGVEVLPDVWRAIKTLMAGIASQRSLSPVAGGAPGCDGPGDGVYNGRALAALARIEGPVLGAANAAANAASAIASLAGGALTGNQLASVAQAIAGAQAATTSRPYVYGVPLAVERLESLALGTAIALAIGGDTVEAYANTTLWNKMVGQLFPLFGMAIAPLVETAVVFADVPCLRTNWWKDVEADEYDAQNVRMSLDRMLRGVGVIQGWANIAGAGTMRQAAMPVVGGCWTADSVDRGDGRMLYVDAPSWLTAGHLIGNPASTFGLPTNSPSADAINPEASLGPVQSLDDLSIFYRRFAHEVYLSEALRGRTAVVPGKLRFDIAPGSNLRLLPHRDPFVTRDDLAANLYVHVARVTVTINAEAPSAGTSFELTNVRTEQENGEARTSTDRHPLFAPSAIWSAGKHGAPLIPAYA